MVSARLDIRVVEQLERASKRLGMTKKRFLEEAIAQKAEAVEGEGQARREALQRAIDASFGAWKRDEPPEETVRKAKAMWTEMYARRRERLDLDRA